MQTNEGSAGITFLWNFYLERVQTNFETCNIYLPMKIHGRPVSAADWQHLFTAVDHVCILA